MAFELLEDYKIEEPLGGNQKHLHVWVAADWRTRLCYLAYCDVIANIVKLASAKESKLKYDLQIKVLLTLICFVTNLLCNTRLVLNAIASETSTKQVSRSTKERLQFILQQWFISERKIKKTNTKTKLNFRVRKVSILPREFSAFFYKAFVALSYRTS